MSLLLIPAKKRRWCPDQPDTKKYRQIGKSSDDLPPIVSLKKAWGWEAVLSPQFRTTGAPPRIIDVPARLFVGSWGWDPMLPPRSRVGNAPLVVEVLPRLLAGTWGWEATLPPAFRAAIDRKSVV